MKLYEISQAAWFVTVRPTGTLARQVVPGVFFVVVLVTTISAADDWLEPRLPSTLKPLNYVLWLHPEFYGGSAVFHGTVHVDIEVLRDTRTIIVHHKQLNITSTSLTDQRGDNIPVSHLSLLGQHSHRCKTNLLFLSRCFTF